MIGAYESVHLRTAGAADAFLSVTVGYRLKGDPADTEPRFTAISGTLICIRNAISILTAGHCIRALQEELIDNSDCEILDPTAWVDEMLAASSDANEGHEPGDR
jgi:hypothetical protein